MGEVEEREREGGEEREGRRFLAAVESSRPCAESCGGRTVARVDGCDREPRLDGRPGYYGLDEAGGILLSDTHWIIEDVVVASWGNLS